MSFLFVIAGSVYAYVVHGEYSIPSGAFVPFVNPNTGRGFIANILIQCGSTMTALVGMVAIEMGSSIIINTYSVMSDMICFNMRKFSDGLRQGTFTYQNKMELRNIFVQLQDLEAYLDEVNDIYYWKFLVQPSLTTGCVALGIFAQFHVSR